MYRRPLKNCSTARRAEVGRGEGRGGQRGLWQTVYNRAGYGAPSTDGMVTLGVGSCSGAKGIQKNVPMGEGGGKVVGAIWESGTFCQNSSFVYAFQHPNLEGEGVSIEWNVYQTRFSLIPPSSFSLTYFPLNKNEIDQIFMFNRPIGTFEPSGEICGSGGGVIVLIYFFVFIVASPMLTYFCADLVVLLLNNPPFFFSVVPSLTL